MEMEKGGGGVTKTLLGFVRDKGQVRGFETLPLDCKRRLDRLINRTFGKCNVDINLLWKREIILRYYHRLCRKGAP